MTYITVNTEKRKVYNHRGDRVRLTQAQYVIIETLAKANGAPISSHELYKAYSPAFEIADFDPAVRANVFHIRQKLPSDDDGDYLVQNVRHHGYRIPVSYREIVQ